MAANGIYIAIIPTLKGPENYAMGVCSRQFSFAGGLAKVHKRTGD